MWADEFTVDNNETVNGNNIGQIKILIGCLKWIDR